MKTSKIHTCFNSILRFKNCVNLLIQCFLVRKAFKKQELGAHWMKLLLRLFTVAPCMFRVMWIKERSILYLSSEHNMRAWRNRSRKREWWRQNMRANMADPFKMKSCEDGWRTFQGRLSSKEHEHELDRHLLDLAIYFRAHLPQTLSRGIITKL